MLLVNLRRITKALKNHRKKVFKIIIRLIITVKMSLALILSITAKQVKIL